jgi:hypothetical protein
LDSDRENSSAENNDHEHGDDDGIEIRVKKRKMEISLKRERKAAITLGILIGLFILCWTPYLFVSFTTAFFPGIKLPRMFPLIGYA